MCLCVMKDEEEEEGWVRRGEEQRGLTSLSKLSFLSFSFLSQGKAVTDNCKINYGEDRQTEEEERQEADNDKEGERGVSGKRSNEKTSDFGPVTASLFKD